MWDISFICIYPRTTLILVCCGELGESNWTISIALNKRAGVLDNNDDMARGRSTKTLERRWNSEIPPETNEALGSLKDGCEIGMSGKADNLGKRNR